MQQICNANIILGRAATLLLLFGLGVGGTHAALAHNAADTPRLRVSLAASTTSASAGDTFEYTVSVTNNTDGTRSVTLSDVIDPQLSVRSASSSKGACQTGNTVTCAFSLEQGDSATITIGVRVQSNLASAAQLLNQAVAQDDIGNSIGSNTVIIAIQPVAIPTSASQPATAVPPTTSPATDVPPTTAALTSTPAPSTSQPTTTTAVPTQATKTPHPTATPRKHHDDDDDDDDDDPTATAEPSATELPTALAVETPTFIAGNEIAMPRGAGTFPNTESTHLQADAPTPVATSTPPPESPTAAPEEPTIAPAQENSGTLIVPTAMPDVSGQTNALPDTAATVPAAGIALVLVGLAFILHATRKVRYADVQLREKTAVSSLAPFVNAALQRQQAATKQLEQARKLLKPTDDE